MPATATRSRENRAETFDQAIPDGAFAPAHEENRFVAPARVLQMSAPEGEDEQGIEWREVAPLVERFTNQVPESERKRRRGLRRRHRNFVMSGVFWVGVLFGIELVGLVFLYSIDLRAIRYEKSLQGQIDKTSLDIALAQNQLAASSNPAKLEGWAAQLGYHKAHLTEMDDVTSSASAPVATSPTE